MIVSSIVTLIAGWCDIDNTKLSKIGREQCVEYLVNCIIDDHGKLTQNEEKLKICVQNGQRRLNVINRHM